MVRPYKQNELQYSIQERLTGYQEESRKTMASMFLGRPD